MALRTPSLEDMIADFRTRRGVYVVGAGASSGIAPFGAQLFNATGASYFNRGGFSVTPAKPIILNKAIRNRIMSGSPADVLIPNRSIRPGTEEPPFEFVLSTMPEEYAHWSLRAQLAGIPRDDFDSYTVFQRFHASLIMNYNLDGLASLCGPQHRILTPHSTIAEWFAGPEAAEILADTGGGDWWPGIEDDAIICVPEVIEHEQRYKLAWSEAANSSPDFIAVIGYSFGSDDGFSFDYFCDWFRGFSGPIYVIAPNPAELRCRVADALDAPKVYGVEAYWNLLAHAVVTRRPYGQILYAACEEMLAEFGRDDVAFAADKMYRAGKLWR